MAEILKDKCSGYPNVTIDIASFEEWKCKTRKCEENRKCEEDQKCDEERKCDKDRTFNKEPKYDEESKYDMIYSAQAFHWINKDIKYQKCYNLLKDRGYLVLFWYKPSGHKFPASIDIDELVNRIVKKYKADFVLDNEKSKRLAHSGVSNNDERKAEIIETGLFSVISEFEYKNTIRNSPSQYLKAINSVPAYASILDGLDGKTIQKVNKEIEDVINNYGGYVDEEFHYTLYIAQKNESKFL